MNINELAKLAIKNDEIDSFLLRKSGYELFIQNSWTNGFLINSIIKNTDENNHEEVYKRLLFYLSLGIISEKDYSSIAQS